MGASSDKQTSSRTSSRKGQIAFQIDISFFNDTTFTHPTTARRTSIRGWIDRPRTCSRTRISDRTEWNLFRSELDCNTGIRYTNWNHCRVHDRYAHVHDRKAEQKPSIRSDLWLLSGPVLPCNFRPYMIHFSHKDSVNQKRVADARTCSCCVRGELMQD